MDLDDYTLLLLFQDRHREMIVAAQRNALLREATRPRRPFRAVLGTALIRLDAWLHTRRSRSTSADVEHESAGR